MNYVRSAGLVAITLIISITACEGDYSKTGSEARGMSWGIFNEDAVSGIDNGTLSIERVFFNDSQSVRFGIWIANCKSNGFSTQSSDQFQGEGDFVLPNGSEVPYTYTYNKSDLERVLFSLGDKDISITNDTLILVRADGQELVIDTIALNLDTIPFDAGGSEVAEFARSNEKISEFFSK